MNPLPPDDLVTFDLFGTLVAVDRPDDPDRGVARETPATRADLPTVERARRWVRVVGVTGVLAVALAGVVSWS